MSNNTIRFPNLGIELHIGKSISIFGFEIAYYGIIIAIRQNIAVDPTNQTAGTPIITCIYYTT